MAQVKRQSRGVIKSVESRTFKEIGDSYEGTLVARKSVMVADGKDSREAILYTLRPDEGEAFGIWGSAQLDDLMSQVEVGTFVRVTFTGTRPPKIKSHSPMRVFEVEPFDQA